MTMEGYQSGRQASSIKLWRTWLRYRGSGIVPECRFLLDEGALSLDDVPQDERVDSLIALIDQLDALRVSGERVQLLEYWGAVECLGGDDVAETMVNYKILDRDHSLRLLTLLDQCVVWSRLAAVSSDSEIVVDGTHCQGDGVARAREKAILKNWTAIVTTPHRFAPGVHSVDKPAQSLPVDVSSPFQLRIIPASFGYSTSGRTYQRRISLNWRDLRFLGWYLLRTSAFANSKVYIVHCDLRWSTISDELTIDSRRYTQLRTVCQMKYRSA